MLFVALCPGTPEGSTGSGSGFKASQKTGQRLKVSSDSDIWLVPFNSRTAVVTEFIVKNSKKLNF